MHESQDSQKDIDQLEAELKALRPKAVSPDMIVELDADYSRCRDRAEARAFEHRKSVRRVLPITAATVGVFACYFWMSNWPQPSDQVGETTVADMPGASSVQDTNPRFSEDQLRQILTEELSIEQPDPNPATPGFLPASAGRFD